jgi:hypothetical protein
MEVSLLALWDDAGGPVRLKIGFRGVRPEDVKIYALYLEVE